LEVEPALAVAMTYATPIFLGAEDIGTNTRINMVFNLKLLPGTVPVAAVNLKQVMMALYALLPVAGN
jgi:hypothetical protein